MEKKFRFGEIFLILLIFILDRLFKNFFLSKEYFFKKIGPINFFLIKNRKIFFNFFSLNFFWLVLIFLILFYLFFKLKESYFKKDPSFFIYFLIFLGASSNLLDRIKYGFVIDYINLGPLFIFNLADLMILIGVLIFILKSRLL
jgi:signal peptidase II